MVIDRIGIPLIANIRRMALNTAGDGDAEGKVVTAAHVTNFISIRVLTFPVRYALKEMV